jgi:hypothetical protein
MTTITPEQYLDQLRQRFNLDVFIRRAVATKLHNAWLDDHMSEQADRVERLETIMTSRDFELIKRHLLTPRERTLVRAALARVPERIRADLDMQQYRLRTEVYGHLGAEPRRRVAEVRCWLLDAIEFLDEMNFYEARRLIVNAEHSLSFLVSSRPQNDKPSRNRMEFDHLLRERTQRVCDALKRDAIALREVAA